MKRKFYYPFTLSNGEVKMMTLDDAAKDQDPAIQKRLHQIVENSKVKRMKHDGFTPGYQEHLGKGVYAGGRREYDKILKEKGLREIGYDYVPTDSTRTVSPCANEEFALAAKEIVPDLTDSEVDAIKTGEMFED